MKWDSLGVSIILPALVYLFDQRNPLPTTVMELAYGFAVVFAILYSSIRFDISLLQRRMKKLENSAGEHLWSDKSTDSGTMSSEAHYRKGKS
jgi:hypothetical protein